MKTLYSTIAFFSAILFLASCTADMEYKEASVSAVEQLFEPVGDKKVELQSTDGASLFFEWSSAKVEDSGAPLYEVVFDKEGGDFSNPIYRIVSDNGGVCNYATITHKTLNKVGIAAGLKGGETGSFEWTVLASRGLNSALAKERRKLTITRLVGIEDTPYRLYLTGTATEAGTDLSQALACVPIGPDKFEIFTKLEAGKTYKLVDNLNGDGRNFYIKDSGIKEDEGETLVEKTGVYRIVFDFPTASVVMREINKMGFYFCPNIDKNDKTYGTLFDINYVSNGIFYGEGKVKFKQESWGRDERYKFVMFYADGTKHFWETKLVFDQRPEQMPELGDTYFYMQEETTKDRWERKWKLDQKFDTEVYNPGAVTKVSVIFNVEHYTHKVELGE